MILHGDCIEMLKTLEKESVQCCVTSPPYWGLRDYGVDGQIGMESSPDDFVQKMLEVFREVWRVLKPDGTLWLNLGDSYNGTGKKHGQTENSPMQKSSKGAITQIGKYAKGLKSKDLVGIPWRVAFALQADGWYLRQDIIWHKPNPMPESVTDRCTKAHEYIFLMSKSEKYYFDAEAIKEPSKDKLGCGNNRQPRQVPSHAEGTLRTNLHKIPVREMRNRRSVWRVTTKPFKGAHFATFPPDLIEPCVLAGSRQDDIVLDPFFGAGTTAVVAEKHGRRYIGIELNADYIEIAKKRLKIDGRLIV